MSPVLIIHKFCDIDTRFKLQSVFHFQKSYKLKRERFCYHHNHETMMLIRRKYHHIDANAWYSFVDLGHHDLARAVSMHYMQPVNQNTRFMIFGEIYYFYDDTNEWVSDYEHTLRQEVDQKLLRLRLNLRRAVIGFLAGAIIQRILKIF